MSIVGSSAVFNINTNDFSPISIKKSCGSSGQEFFEAYIENEKIGMMEVTWLRVLPNQKYGSELFSEGIEFGPLAGYGFEKTASKLNKVFIRNMQSHKNQEYRGVGNALMQVAIEFGLQKNCDGRVIIDASWNSHGFWYKQGMRSVKNKTIDETIAKELEAAKIEDRAPNTEDLGSVYMYLPSEKIAAWIEKIKKDPILFNTQLGI